MTAELTLYDIIEKNVGLHLTIVPQEKGYPFKFEIFYNNNDEFEFIDMNLDRKDIKILKVFLNSIDDL